MVKNNLVHQLQSALKNWWGLSESDWALRQNPPTHVSYTTIPGSVDFLNLLIQHQGKRCVIYPDYDPDGIFSGLLMYLTLKGLGLDVELIAPRTSDGFGLTERSVARILNDYPSCDVVITTDNGSAAIEGVGLLKKAGKIVLVTDHHVPSDPLPQADVVVNPLCQEDHVFPRISGCSVVWSVLEPLVRRVNPVWKEEFYLLRLLNGITAVSDFMPMLRENVSAVRQFEMVFNSPMQLQTLAQNTASPYHSLWCGLAALDSVLIEKKRVKEGLYDGDTIGFYIAPLLNASRRMTESSELAFSMFLQDTTQKARMILEELWSVNESRKSVQSRLEREFDEREDTGTVSSHVVVGHLHGGMVGLMAGWLKERYQVPMLVLGDHVPDAHASSFLAQIDGVDVLSGSGRSVEWLDFQSAIGRIEQSNPEYVHHFGGHALACGIGVYRQYLDDFCKAFDVEVQRAWRAYLEVLPEQDETSSLGMFVAFLKKQGCDVRRLTSAFGLVFGDECALEWQMHQVNASGNLTDDLTRLPFAYPVSTLSDIKSVFEFLTWIELLAPFGSDFPRPIGTYVFKRTEFKKIGMSFDSESGDYKHVKAVHHALPIEVVEFYQTGVLHGLLEDASQELIVLTGQLTINTFGGTKRLQFVIN